MMEDSEVPENTRPADTDKRHPSDLIEDFHSPNAMNFPSTSDLPIGSDLQSGPDLPSRWQENHGTLLMIFVAVILVLGSILLAYRQNRFVPPRFPDGEFIETISESDPATGVLGDDFVAIEVTGAVTDIGNIAIAIFDAETNFNQPAEANLAYEGEVVEGKTTWKIPRDQMPDRFAIAAYHDENDDSELNRNRFGIPIERYGFSSNARGIVGPPSFKEAVMNRPAAGQTIVITIR